jgi:hypothetical protein
MIVKFKDSDCLNKYRFDLQCKYGNVVALYIKKMKYGKSTKAIFEHLDILTSLLNIVNKYDSRDIGVDYNEHNLLTQEDIKKIIVKMYKILSLYNE